MSANAGGFDAWMAERLAQLEATGLRRRLAAWPATGGRLPGPGRPLLNFSSNDYLGLARHPRVVEAACAALRRFGAGATASRLVCGNLDLHEELERRLADLKRCPSALVFASGYAANVGLLSALAGRGDTVLADRLAHASLLDGARLSGARLRRFRHNDPDHLEALLKEAGAGRRWIVTESVFSMDGDLAPLGDVWRLAQEHDAALIVDEAHATGIYGPGGAGRTAELSSPAENLIAMGTLSKALGAQGGFVAGSVRLREWLIQSARSLIYSTGLTPAAAGGAIGALDALAAEPGLGASLRRRSAAFRRALRAGGVDAPAGDSPIIPLIVGDARQAIELSRRLAEAGILAVAIRPPTVPPGTARLRFSLSLNLSEDETMAAAAVVAAVWKERRG